MGTVYLIDASSWIKAQAMEVPEDNRTRLWEWFERMATEGRICTVQVVVEEVLRNRPDAHARMTKFLGEPRFVVSKREQLKDPDEAKELQEIGERFRSLRRNLKGREKGDAYLIARARITGHVVVTEEGAGKGKIPAVCRELSVECRTLLELVIAEGLI